jgi:GxxExxY protein
MKHADLTEKIIAAFYQVYNTLGWGFLEKVYHFALLHELRKRGIEVETQAKIDVFYDGLLVGEYYADLLVENLVIVELKTAEQLTSAHEAQLLNYLKATPIEVRLLFNFGPKPQFKRKVFETARKLSAPSLPPTEAPDDPL